MTNSVPISEVSVCERGSTGESVFLLHRSIIELL
jgi:hypothetical protein